MAGSANLVCKSVALPLPRGRAAELKTDSPLRAPGAYAPDRQFPKFLTFQPFSEGPRGPHFMAMATFLVNVGQLVAGIIALVVLVRRK